MSLHKKLEKRQMEEMQRNKSVLGIKQLMNHWLLSVTWFQPYVLKSYNVFHIDHNTLMIYIYNFSIVVVKYVQKC